MPLFPKITLITPNYNGAKYLEETILSVVSQNYPNLEYIIIDGGSTDESVEIIKKYEQHLTYWVSEPDKGLYHALQKGFKMSTGEIMGWLNSDDMLHHGALATINEIFNISNRINWLQGQPTIFDELGRTVAIGPQKKWSKYNAWMGDFKWIQQESTFWRRTLWVKSGEYINLEYNFASDFELWNRFFKHEKLYTTLALIGGFRMRSCNQLSLDNMDKYIGEVHEIIYLNKYTLQDLEVIKKLKKLYKTRLLFQKTRILNQVGILRRIDNEIELLLEFPNKIEFNRNKQKFEIK